MTLHDAYDPTNIFAKILKGEMPSIKVYEDEVALAFMDVFPQSEGHTLVIPKQVQARNFLDMPSDYLGQYMLKVQKVARAVEAGLKPDGLLVTQFNGAPAGQTVFHLHVHILPMREGDTIRPHTGQMADHGLLAKHAEMIRAALD